MKAYIFDLDGTLLDSMGVWANIDIDFLKKRGINAPDDYTGTVLSMSLQEAAAYTIERFELPESVGSLIQEWNEMAAYAYGNTVKMKPHAKDYIVALHENGAKLAIATSLPARLYEPALRNLGIFGLFHVICSTDEVDFGKTRPDIFLHAAKKLGVPPLDCIVFEDILAAIKSAKSIGMTVYGVYDKSSEADWEQIMEIADGIIIDFRNAPPCLAKHNKEETVCHFQEV